MRPRRLLLGLPAALSAGRQRPALAIVLVLGLAISPIVRASGVAPGASPPAEAGAPGPPPGDPRPYAAPLPEPIGITSRISERQGGGDAGGSSAEPSISADGLYVAFSSLAPDLVAGDNNGSQDVFVRNRVSGVTIRLPILDQVFGPPGGSASEPAISPDGGFVAFTYTPPAARQTLDVQVTQQGPLVMLWDAASGTTKVASVDRNGRPAFGSFEPAISAGGRYVAYTSLNPNITAGDTNRQTDVFRVDTQTGDTTMVSQTPSGTSPKGSSRSPAISADGSIVAFTSNAPNILVPDPTPTPPPRPSPSPSPLPSLFTIDLVPPNLARAGVAAVGAVGPRSVPAATSLVTATGVIASSISAGSTSVIVNVTGCSFKATSPAGGVPGSLNFATGESRVIFSAASGPGSGQQTLTIQPTEDSHPAGEVVAQGGVPGCTPPSDGIGSITIQPFAEQVYARNVPSSSTELISITPNGGPSSGRSILPSISADGSVIAFVSFGTDLAAGDGDSAGDVYVRERNVGRTSLLTADMPEVSGADISGNGQFVAFSSATGATGGFEVFHRDRFDGTTVHISVALTGGDGGASNLEPVVSAEGRYVAWTSTSAQLIAHDGNGLGDVFVRDLPPAGAVDPPLLDFGTRALGTTSQPANATLTSIGWSPLGSIVATIDGGNAADFQIVSDGCTGVVLPRPLSCTVVFQFSPQAVGPRSSTLKVTDNGVGSPHTVRLIGVGSKLDFVVDPPSGPPGIVTIASGKGFPPNTVVILRWTVGINEQRAPVVTDSKGAFQTQVLVFHHDVEGLRDLVASPADGKAFRPIAVDFFVSKHTGEPPGWSDPANPGYEPQRGWFQQ